MVWDAVIFMPEYGESGKFRGFGLEALVGEFSYGAKLVVVGIPEEGQDSGVVGPSVFEPPASSKTSQPL